MEENKYPINEIQKKGLMLIVKALSKKYKFIKGIELIDEYEKYNNLLFVNIIMDYSEFAKTYNYYTKKLTYTRIASTGISSFMSRDAESWIGSTDDAIYEEIKLIREEIERTLNNYYSSLPSEYQATYVTSWNDVRVRELAISQYIDVE